jgi:hypothetical protein
VLLIFLQLFTLGIKSSKNEKARLKQDQPGFLMNVLELFNTHILNKGIKKSSLKNGRVLSTR